MKPVFHFISLFPEIIGPWLNTSILGRAFEKKLFNFFTYQLRDFSQDKHRSVDDVAYGGGGGMVLKVEPLVSAMNHVEQVIGAHPRTRIYFSPTGERLTSSVLSSFLYPKGEHHFVLVCGHYEGVDQRFIDGWIDREVSLGDFVLTGGELPALAFADSLIRQLDGSLGAERGAKNESFSLRGECGTPLLEYPHFTRPYEFQGRRVPEVLISGNHQAIHEWRTAMSEKRTREKRPDLNEPNF